MLVNATELKNNLGKYLREAMREEVIVVSNGRKVARLTAYDEYYSEAAGLPLGKTAEAYTEASYKAAYEEFLELSGKGESRYEFIDGVIYQLASPTTAHQQVLGELYFAFASWFRGKNCRPMLAPYDITLKRTTFDINVVQPDLMVICDMEKHLNEKGYYMGVPSLVVEILSTSSRSKDSVRKLDLYLSTGVQEYWIINPFNQEVTIYRFTEKNLADSRSFRLGDAAESFLFEGLAVVVADLFS